MIIKLHGETSLNKLPKIIKEVVGNISEKNGLEADKVVVKDAEIGILFVVGKEKHFLSVTHDEVSEMFQVHVKLDNKGNIDLQKDNEKESFLDDYTKAISRNEQPKAGTEQIESVFKDEDLIFIGEENGGDLVAEHFRHKTEAMNVIRYYRNGILVGETGYEKKEA